jgi:hypothetical protein
VCVYIYIYMYILYRLLLTLLGGKQKDAIRLQPSAVHLGDTTFTMVAFLCVAQN